MGGVEFHGWKKNETILKSLFLWPMEDPIRIVLFVLFTLRVASELRAHFCSILQLMFPSFFFWVLLVYWLYLGMMPPTGVFWNQYCNKNKDKRYNYPCLITTTLPRSSSLSPIQTHQSVNFFIGTNWTNFR